MGLQVDYKHRLRGTPKLPTLFFNVHHWFFHFLNHLYASFLVEETVFQSNLLDYLKEHSQSVCLKMKDRLAQLKEVGTGEHHQQAHTAHTCSSALMLMVKHQSGANNATAVTEQQHISMFKTHSVF